MKNTPHLQIIYDGNCPLCCNKVKHLQKLDQRQRLQFTDFRAPEFQALQIQIPLSHLEKQIHAIQPNGEIISRMDVIRAAYQAIGLGWLISPTEWPGLKPLFEGLYGLIARNRMFLSRFYKK